MSKISAEISKAISRQSGEIYLEPGTENWGKQHIGRVHGAKIKSIGVSVDDFVKVVCQNFNEVRAGNKGALLLVRSIGTQAVVVKLVPGDFYSVYSAFPTTTRYLKNKKLLWSQAEITGDTKSALGAAVNPQRPSKAEISGVSVGSHKSLSTKSQKVDQWLKAQDALQKKRSEKPKSRVKTKRQGLNGMILGIDDPPLSGPEKPLPSLPLSESKDTENRAKGSTQKKVAGLGFTTADQVPARAEETFRLPGPIGGLLQDLQAYKLEIVVAGETHSSKSELAKQIADAFASAGYEVGYLDWEQGGMESRDTAEAMKRNVGPENLKKIHVSAEVPRTLEALKSLACKFKVIVVDSGTKLNQVTNAWIDELRTEYPDTIWVILMQQNVKGGTRGGSSAEFDAPVVIFTYRPDESDYRKNYAYLFKNRGNKTGIYYNIAEKKIIADPNQKTDADK